MSEEVPVVLPEGEYAIVEILGHRTLIGRISEVERFGSRLLSVEPVFQNQLLPPALIGGGSIYQLTPCTAEVAAKEQPKHDYQLPSVIAITIPPAMLEGPENFPPAFLTNEED